MFYIDCSSWIPVRYFQLWVQGPEYWFQISSSFVILCMSILVLLCYTSDIVQRFMNRYWFLSSNWYSYLIQNCHHELDSPKYGKGLIHTEQLSLIGTLPFSRLRISKQRDLCTKLNKYGLCIFRNFQICVQ